MLWLSPFAIAGTTFPALSFIWLPAFMKTVEMLQPGGRCSAVRLGWNGPVGWKAIAKSWGHRNAHTPKQKYDWAPFSSRYLVSQHCGGIFTVSFISVCQNHSLEFVLFHLVLAPGVEINFKTRGKHKELAHSGVLALISPEPLTHSVIFGKAVDLPVLCATQLENGVKKRKKSNGNFTQRSRCKDFLDKQITQALLLQPPQSSSLLCAL